MPLCRTRSSCSTECRRERERKASMKTASRRPFYRGPTPFRTRALQNLSFLNLHPFLSLSTLQFLVMGRAPCCDKANVKRGPWSPEEDAALRRYIEVHGTGGNWIALPQKAGLKRCGKSCRLRWLNYLRPDIKHGGFTEDEDNIIFTLYKNIGSRWSIIASKLPGRTDNDVKNYWNTKLKKRIMAAGETNIPSAFTTMSKFHHLSWSPASPSTTTSQLSPQPLTVPIPTTKTEAFIDGRPALDFDYSNYPFDSYHLPQLPMPTGIVASPPVDSATSSSISIDNSSGGMSYMNWNCYNRAYNDDAAFMPDLGFGFFSGNEQSPPEEVYQSLIN